MTADWPHLTGAAAQVPILVWYANNDQTIPADVAQCVFNRLTSDSANYQLCYDPNPVGHAGVVSDHSDYVSDWIAQKTLGGPAPTESCGALAPNDAGVPADRRRLGRGHPVQLASPPGVATPRESADGRSSRRPAAGGAARR